MKTQKEIRIAFKETCSEYKTSKKHNQQNCNVRMQFVDFIDGLRRDNLITEKLASNATLG